MELLGHSYHGYCDFKSMVIVATKRRQAVPPSYTHEDLITHKGKQLPFKSQSTREGDRRIEITYFSS